MSSRSLGHRAPLMWLVLPMMVGLAVGRMVEGVSPFRLLIVALALATTAVANVGRPRVWAGSIAVALIFAGVASYGLHRMRLPQWDGRPPREAKLSLRVERVFPLSDPRKATGLALIVRSEAHVPELLGQRIYFALGLKRGEVAPLPTAEIATSGVVSALPRDPPSNSFEGYLANAGINFRLQRGRALATEKPATAYARFCARAVARFKTILSLGIAKKRPELAALLRAMMLGETNELSEEQHTLFRESGTMHLFAISGMNIAVIAGAMHAMLLLPLRRWPLVQFGFGAAVLWLFVDITGGAPSAVRAFSMAVFLQGAFAWWKPANVLAALTASALLVLVWAPLQFFSASFVMSYGIIATLLLLGLPLGEAWTARWNPGANLPKVTWRWWHHAAETIWRWLASALAVGVSTTLVGLLTGVYYFGLLTPGALATNLLLIPLASWATLGGFTSLVLGLVGWDSGAAFCNHGSALVLLWIEWVVRGGVKVPGAFTPAQFVTPGLGGPTIAAVGLGLLVGYAMSWRRSAGSFWPPFVMVALVLMFGVKFG